MATVGTTISCRAFGFAAVLLVSLAGSATAADRPSPPKLPVTIHWTNDLQAGVSAPPVSDADRIYVALRSGQLIALAIPDGHALWLVQKAVTAPMAAADGLLYVSVTDAIEAVHGNNGANAWTAPRIKAIAPLVVSGDLVFAVTDAEIVALRAKDGQVAWRHAAGGVRLAPARDADYLFVGADDGRIAALSVATGDVVWEKFVEGGVGSLAASRGLVYAGAGDKQFHCLDGRKGDEKWHKFIGSIPSGAIAVDDDHVYFTAPDNVVRGLDRKTGNQRWQQSLSKRPVGGVRLAGHIVFVQLIGKELVMLFDRNGRPSGTVPLPGETNRDTPPDVRETPNGVNVLVVTGGLSNQWQLTLIGPGSEPALEPFSRLATLPGVDFLTDPLLAPIGRVLSWLMLGERDLVPLSAFEWPIVLRDPPLEPLTTLPGLQLRPLSPVLPARRGA